MLGLLWAQTLGFWDRSFPGPAQRGRASLEIRSPSASPSSCPCSLSLQLEFLALTDSWLFFLGVTTLGIILALFLGFPFFPPFFFFLPQTEKQSNPRRVHLQEGLREGPGFLGLFQEFFGMQAAPFGSEKVGFRCIPGKSPFPWKIPFPMENLPSCPRPHRNPGPDPSWGWTQQGKIGAGDNSQWSWGWNSSWRIFSSQTRGKS